MDPDKDPRADAKLKGLPEEELDILWGFRNPEKGIKRLTFSRIRVEIPIRYGVTVSSSTLSEFYVWLKLKRRFQERTRRIDQIKLEMAKDPGISAEQVEKTGQVLFMTEGIVAQDPKVFANMVKIGQGRTKLEQNQHRLKQTDESLAMESRRVALLEKKALRLDALEAKAKEIKAAGGLSAETLEVIEKQLKLL
jgi:hypothetical protein